MSTIATSFLPDQIGNVTTFLVLGCLAAMLLSAAKAGFGGSIGLLAGPIMIYACGDNTTLAMGLMLPLLIACDQVSIVSWRGKWDFHAAMLLVPGAILGIAAGTAALWGFQQLGADGQGKTVTDASLKLGIGIIALSFVLLQIFRLMRGRSLKFRPIFWQGTLVGTTAGFTSTLAHAAGPVVAMYMLPQRMPKGRYVATTVLYYWIGNLLKVPTYVALGLLNADSLRASVALMPAVLVGTLLGLYLHRRVDQRSFTGVVYLLLTFAGADLIRKALTELL